VGRLENMQILDAFMRELRRTTKDTPAPCLQTTKMEFKLLNINRSGEDDLLDIIYSLTSALNTSLSQNDGGSQRPEKLQYVTIDVGTIHHDFRQLVRHLPGDEEKRGQSYR
jgi:hypothetical protein